MRTRDQEEHRPKLPGYEVLERIGKGGMGEVYSATKVGPAGFRKELAIKRLRMGRTTEEAVQRFLREARVSAALDHPNIVHVHDLIEDSGDYFMVMERLRGMDLRAALRASEEAPPLGVVVEVGGQVLQGLAEAHALTDDSGRTLGLVHRDLTPRNIFLCRSGAVKVLDFGVARLRFVGPDRHLTRDGQTLGTLPYLPPEVQLGHQPDSRSDLYQVGLLLYLMLTGERPVVKRDGVKAPRLAEIPGPMRAVVARALAMDPRDRFADAEQMHDELRAVDPTPRRRALVHWLKLLEGDDELGLPEAVNLPSASPQSMAKVPAMPSMPPLQGPTSTEPTSQRSASTGPVSATSSTLGELSSSESGSSSLSIAEGPPISRHPPALNLGEEVPRKASSAASAVLRRDVPEASAEELPPIDGAPTVMAMRPDFLVEGLGPDDIETADAVDPASLLREPGVPGSTPPIPSSPPFPEASPAPAETSPAPKPSPVLEFSAPKPALSKSPGALPKLWMGLAILAAVLVGVFLAIVTSP